MKKEVKLVNKIKRLLNRLKCPRWLHHFGPKTYEFYEHLTALLVRAYCKGMSYRRVVKLFGLLGIRCPSKSALQYTARKISSTLWQKILDITSGGKHYLVAIDSTGLSRTNPSYHYLRRIDGKIPKIAVKMSVAFDTRKKKFCAAKIRVLPAHDIKDAQSLLERSHPKISVADKAYDANWLHEYCHKQNIKAYIPLRKKGKPKHRNMSQRIKASKQFNIRTYHRRELIESGISAVKRTEGSSVSSQNARTVRSEVYSKLICYNLFYYLFRLLGQSLLFRKLYKCKIK